MSRARVTSTRIHDAAERLQTAARTGVPCAPVRDLIGTSNTTLAYAVQQRVVAARRSAGARVVGRKVGLTSLAVQAQLGVDQPDFGVLLDDMRLEDGAAVPWSTVLQPRVEAEVAFTLDADLSHGPLDLRQVRAAVGQVVPAIEVCGSRIAGWDLSYGDTIADNASSGVFVLGSAPVSLQEVCPRDVDMELSVDGSVSSSGTGTACLGDPLLALQWLARRAHDLGDPLRAGQVVLSGALGPMVAVQPGALVTATISGLGTVTVRFGNGPDKEIV